MPRGPTTYTLPPGTTPQVPNTIIPSATWNAALDDIATTFNTPQPLAYGGTGGTSAITGYDALDTRGAAVATASSINLTTATGPNLHLTGTTTVSTVTLASGAVREAIADGVFQLTASANLIVNGKTGTNYTTTAGDLLIFIGDPSSVVRVWTIGAAASNSALTSNAPFINLSLVASVNSNALTIAVKGVDGNDPSASNPVYVSFRSATAGSGALSQLTLTAALSLVVSSGSTLGSTSGVATTYALAIFNDAGTPRLAIINPTTLPLVDGIASSTAEGGAGAADSAGVFYTGAAATSKAYTIIGYLTATEATAGTWATAPSTVQVGIAPAVANAVPNVTLAKAYTPTFTGLGTPTNVSAWSARVGKYLIGNIKFTSGTATGVEARASIGFNGVDGNVTVDSTLVTSLSQAGVGVITTAGVIIYYALMEGGVKYLTFGFQNSSTGGLNKQTGTSYGSSVTVDYNFCVPIQEFT